MVDICWEDDHKAMDVEVRKEMTCKKYVRTEEGFVVFEKWVKKNRPCRRLVCDPERREG